jgi:hypothetical protein
MKKTHSVVACGMLFLICGLTFLGQGYTNPEDSVAAIQAVINQVLLEYGFNVLDAAVTETGMHQFNIVSRDGKDAFVLRGNASLESMSPVHWTLSDVERLDISLTDEARSLQIWITRVLKTTKNGKTVHSQLTATLAQNRAIPYDGIFTETTTTTIAEGDTSLASIASFLLTAEIGTTVKLKSSGQRTKGHDLILISRNWQAVKTDASTLAWEGQLEAIDLRRWIVCTENVRGKSHLEAISSLWLNSEIGYRLSNTYYGLDLASCNPHSTTVEYVLTGVRVEPVGEASDWEGLRTVLAFKRTAATAADETLMVGNQIRTKASQSLQHAGKGLSHATYISSIDPRESEEDESSYPGIPTTVLPLLYPTDEDIIEPGEEEISGPGIPTTMTPLMKEAMNRRSVQAMGLGCLVGIFAGGPIAVWAGAEAGTLSGFLYEQYFGILAGQVASDLYQIFTEEDEKHMENRSNQAMDALRQKYSLDVRSGGKTTLKQKPVMEPEPRYVGYWHGSITFEGKTYSLSITISDYDPATRTLASSSCSIAGKSVPPPPPMIIRGNKIVFQSPWVGITAHIRNSTITGTIQLENVYWFGIIQGPGSGTWWLSKRR